MAHTEPRSTPLREGAIAVVTGAVYGCVTMAKASPREMRARGTGILGQSPWIVGTASASRIGTKRGTS